MAARSWEDFDRDLAEGITPVRREMLERMKLAKAGTATDAKRANPVRITYCPTAIAPGAVFMGGKPNLPRVSRKRRAA